jgi:hypothetical protein
LLLILGLLLAACQPDAAPQNSAITPVQAKLLATVFISPTPDAAQQQATRLAFQPTMPAPAPTALPSATVYVGVFLEPAADPDEDVPLLDPTQIFALIPNLPTERPSRCQIPVDPRFGEAWRSAGQAAQAMACPVETPVEFTGVVQVFERGVMYFQGGGPIWAVEATNDGFPDRHWTITQALPPVEGDGGVTAPDGLKVPAFGFGAVWFGVAGVRDRLGFARTDEQQAQLMYQRFEGGTLFLDVTSDLVFILLSNGAAFGPF